LFFDHAYATYSGENDRLQIYTSTNGGTNWTSLILLNGGTAGPLNTGGTTTGYFVPTAGQWATKKYALPVGTNRVRFTAISAYGNCLYVDNIQVTGALPDHDVAINDLIAPRYNLSPFTPQAQAKNCGNNAETFLVSMMIDSAGTIVYSESLTVSNLASGDTSTVSFPMWTPTIGEVYNLSAYTTMAGDQVASNDTAKAVTSSYNTPRTVMAELFTSTTCAPCVQANTSLNNLYPVWSDSLVIIRYHMNWPAPGNDPFYAANSAENGARRRYYAVNAVPDLWINGNSYGSDGSTFEAAFAGERAIYGPMIISLSGSYDSVANTGRVRATLTATGRITDTNLRLRYAIIQDTVSYTGTNGDPTHHQVMRDLLPDSLGTPITINKGETLVDSVNFNYGPAWPYTTEMRHRVIAFLQSHSSKVVYQAARISFAEILTGITGEPVQTGLVSTTQLLPCHPNPAGGQVSFSYRLNSPGQVSLNIYDIAGRLVHSLVDEKQNAGAHTVTWNGANEGGQRLASGIYFYKLTAGGYSAVKKITILR
jgi:hypothetical protein